MARWVPCAECGNRYDGGATAFCPRCGSTLKGKDPEQRIPVRDDDPRRRRAQMGGALFMFMGLAILALWAYGLANAGFHAEDAIDGFVGLTGDSPIPAGDLRVRVLGNGTPLDGAQVAIRLPSGLPYRLGETDGDGWYNVSLGRQAAITVNVTWEGAGVERRVFVAWPHEERLELDVRRDAPRSDAWVGLDQFDALSRLLVVLVGVASVLMAAGGAAALALRYPALAVAAPLPAMALTALLFLWTLLVGVFYVGIAVLMGLQATALAMVAAGRMAFLRRP